MRYSRLFFVLFFVLTISVSYANMTPAFLAGQQTGNNFAKAMARSEEKNRVMNDNNAIQRILNKVRRSENPEDFQDAIYEVLTQVSPERQDTVITFLQNRYNQLKVNQR